VKLTGTTVLSLGCIATAALIVAVPCMGAAALDTVRDFDLSPL